jgi:hypothetical protein
MASSFITIDEIHGIWIDDHLMQVVCWGIVKTIDKKVPLLERNFRNHLYDISQGLFVGFIDLRLNEYLNDSAKISEFEECLEATKNSFTDKGEFMSMIELNAFQVNPETKREWLQPLRTARVIKILEYLQDLIKGRIKSKASDVGEEF